MNNEYYKNNKEYIKIFNELINNIKNSEIDINTLSQTALINFVTKFRTSDINLFKTYIGEKRSIDLDIKIALKLLGYDKLEGNEEAVFKLLYNNIIYNGYGYHLTNTAGYNNIYENGLDPEQKKETLEEVKKVYDKLSNETKKEFFDLVFSLNDTDKYCYSVCPLIDRTPYGIAPEWYQRLTAYNTDYEKAKKYVIKVLTKNNESEENVQMVLNLFEKYWNINMVDSDRIQVMLPLRETEEIYLDADEIVTALNEKIANDNLILVLDHFVYNLADQVDRKTNIKIQPENLLFFNCNNLNIHEKNYFFNQNKKEDFNNISKML